MYIVNSHRDSLAGLFAVVDPWDLQQHYGDNRMLIGEPDRSLVNRHQRYEVSYFINSFCKKHGVNKLGALHAEMLLQRAPGHLRSRENLTTWLEEHWNDALVYSNLLSSGPRGLLGGGQ